MKKKKGRMERQERRMESEAGKVEDGKIRTKSLLSRTLTQCLACMVAVFVLTAPLFYLLTKYFYAEDMIDIIESVKSGQGIPPLDLERDIMAGMLLQFLLIFVVISLSVFITVRFITLRLWHPFDDTLCKTEQFNLAQGDIPEFMATDIREFARLNRSIEKLMRKDKETFRIQKEFTENASHELQTPLAVIRGKLDLLMQENLGERKMRLVSDLYLLTTRLSHLNRNLLLLAKIENAQYTAMEEVDIASMIEESMPLYDVVQGGMTMRAYDRRTLRDVSLRANPILLECLLKNLVVNAMRHSAPGGEIRILIEDGRLTVSNPSADNVPLDPAMLFRRFGSANMRNAGNGLGLAIVKAVCDFHGWTVEYGYGEGRHRFMVTFGKAD